MVRYGAAWSSTDGGKLMRSVPADTIPQNPAPPPGISPSAATKPVPDGYKNLLRAGSSEQ